MPRSCGATDWPDLGRPGLGHSGSATRQNGGSARGYQDFFAPSAGTAVPDTTGLQPRRIVYLSLSHKQFGVSYCEIDPMGRAGLLPHTAMASADL